MDPNIGANLPEEERRRFHEEFDAAVLSVRSEEAARRDEERPHNQETSLGGAPFSRPSIPRKSQHEHSSINGQQAHC